MRRSNSLKIAKNDNKHIYRDCTSVDMEYFEEQALLYERLLKAEEVSVGVICLQI